MIHIYIYLFIYLFIYIGLFPANSDHNWEHKKKHHEISLTLGPCGLDWPFLMAISQIRNPFWIQFGRQHYDISKKQTALCSKQTVGLDDL